MQLSGSPGDGSTRWTPPGDCMLGFIAWRLHGIYGRKDLHTPISPRLRIRSARPKPLLYGQKDLHAPISPRLCFATLWAKPTPAIHFAHTPHSRRASQTSVLWAKSPTCADFAQTPLRHFMGETEPNRLFRPDSAFAPRVQCPYDSPAITIIGAPLSRRATHQILRIFVYRSASIAAR